MPTQQPQPINPISQLLTLLPQLKIFRAPSATPHARIPQGPAHVGLLQEFENLKTEPVKLCCVIYSKNLQAMLIPKDCQWAVKCEGGKATRVFSTQQEAIETARIIAKAESSGQLVVHGRNGQIREQHMACRRSKTPPSKKSTKIEKA